MMHPFETTTEEALMKKLYSEKILPAKIAAMDREDLAELAEGNPLHIRALCSLRTNSEEATDDTLCMPEEDVVYGSLLVIGYKEYMVEDGALTPFGTRGDIYLLKKRSKSNGLCIGLPRKVLGATGEPPSICYSSVADPSVDLFQIGRAESNDIDARGHYSRRDVSSRRGSVSRYAARIHCERDPPHGVRIFASGFNKNKDGFTTSGCKLWTPLTKEWCEISIKGKAYSIKREESYLGAAFSNELTNGSIIDLNGLILMFIGKQESGGCFTVPECLLNDLNALKLQCPVQLNNICLQIIDKAMQKKIAIDSLAAHGRYLKYSELRIPEEIGDSDESAYIFPACGHVYGFHKGFLNRPCPLCRTAGPFVPLKIVYEKVICTQSPTHVFNPCGHAASLEVVQYWSSIRFIFDVESCQDDHSPRPRCPYCAMFLADTYAGGPFKKMVFHHDNVTEETDVAVSLFDDDRCTAGIDYRNAEVAPRFTIKQLI